MVEGRFREESIQKQSPLAPGTATDMGSLAIMTAVELERPRR
jgi:hypothetical protein